MEIITQNADLLQREALMNVLCGVPIVLVDGENKAYILVQELSEELHKFIYTENADVDELNTLQNEYKFEPDELSLLPKKHVLAFNELNALPRKYEYELFKQWRSANFEYKYCSQPFEYMHKKINIRYPQVRNPQTELEFSIIPWFFLPDRPYPVFLYAYAIWHYNNTTPKSMELSATVAGEIFGVNSFHKSTISRNKKEMERLFNSINIYNPLSVEEPPPPSISEISVKITEALKINTSLDSLIETLNFDAARLPRPTGRGDAVSYALSKIPIELSKALSERPPAGNNPRDIRSRPARPHEHREKKDKPKPAYAESHEITRIRLSFIAICRAIVMDAAITFHRFLK